MRRERLNRKQAIRRLPGRVVPAAGGVWLAARYEVTGPTPVVIVNDGAAPAQCWVPCQSGVDRDSLTLHTGFW
jgi:hypothetical protein